MSEDEIVEPWIPVIGQPIVVRLNAECSHYHDGRPGGGGAQRLLYGHHGSMDGAHGYVAHVDPHGVNFAGHRFNVVVTDRTIPGFIGRTTYAATELEPLD